MEYAKVSGKNVVIKLPIEVLEVAFNNNPNNYDEDIKVKYRKQFAQGFADLVNELSSDSESGLTVFQEWIDSIFEEMVEGGYPYIKFPKEED